MHGRDRGSVCVEVYRKSHPGTRYTQKYPGVVVVAGEVVEHVYFSVSNVSLKTKIKKD